ncbi:hypothetical protein [Tenuifilum thalassicum]|uniref:Uncharacterized protein n=1 Tax=Tenuifilum thalassicum TaxID=2590900 RepID=A0A7D4BRD1_9BACT|nr:hypothetical protein [Tenuifilum thalassicum]QKG79561.1 hypothetical protein FHG85_04560 [Tenuifilum thalassicum]
MENPVMDLEKLNPYDSYGKKHNQELSDLIGNHELKKMKGKQFYGYALKLMNEKHHFKTIVNENYVYNFVESYTANPIQFTDSILQNYSFSKNYVRQFLSEISEADEMIDYTRLIEDFEYNVIVKSDISQQEKELLLVYFATFRNSYNFWNKYVKKDSKKFPFPAWVVYGADAIGLVSGIFTTPFVAFPLAAIVSYGAYKKE